MHSSLPHFSSKVAAFFIAGALLAGCKSNSSDFSPSPPKVAPPIAVLQGAAVDSAPLPARAGANLYVAIANSGVTVYVRGTKKVLRTIGVNGADALAFDGSGNLFVATILNTVTEYARGTTEELRTISHGVKQPLALAFSRSGNLFVANFGNNSMTVYARGKDVGATDDLSGRERTRRAGVWWPRQRICRKLRR